MLRNKFSEAWRKNCNDNFVEETKNENFISSIKGFEMSAELLVKKPWFD